jgi:LexA-binding, inner membrane-associated putative hydrolase
MADFRTHLAVASTVSGVLAIGTMVAGVATPKEVVLLFCAGTMGGVLPDIDSDHTIPVQILFSVLAVGLAFMSVFSRADTYSVVELSLLWISVYLFVRYVLYKIFAKFTVHRGIFHSQLAALFFLLFNAAIAYHLFGLSAVSAWLVGCFVALGYLIHLLLDEIYSVDMTGARVKKSFGTALKFASFEDPKTSLALGVATVALFLAVTPALSEFVHTLASQRAFASLHERFLPKDRWFSISFPRHVEGAGRPTSGGTDDTLSTGSIRRGN